MKRVNPQGADRARVERLHVGGTGRSFELRELPGGDVGRYVTRRHDRGDVVADWQCTGSARMALPADLVARWAPGGSPSAPGPAGIAGILGTFDTAVTEVTEVTVVEPAELVAACHELAARWSSA